MNRRSFLTGLASLIGGVAVAEAIPFNRVWSFPSNIIIPEIRYQQAFDNAVVWYNQEALAMLARNLTLDKHFANCFPKQFIVGSSLPMREPLQIEVFRPHLTAEYLHSHHTIASLLSDSAHSETS